MSWKSNLIYILKFLSTVQNLKKKFFWFFTLSSEKLMGKRRAHFGVSDNTSMCACATLKRKVNNIKTIYLWKFFCIVTLTDLLENKMNMKISRCAAYWCTVVRLSLVEEIWPLASQLTNIFALEIAMSGISIQVTSPLKKFKWMHFLSLQTFTSVIK